MAKLTIYSAEGTRDVELGPFTTIGRHPDNSLQLLDRIVSKNHATITLQGGQYLLKDLQSLNGMFVNGMRAYEHTLRNGDDISMGNTRLVFSDERQGGAEGAKVAIAAPDSTVAESHIRDKITSQASDRFLPAGEIKDMDALRRDYEKLRIVHELQKAIGLELDLDRLLQTILRLTFEFLPADRGAMLLYDDKGNLYPRSVRTRRGKKDDPIHLSQTVLNVVATERAAVLSSDAMMDARFQSSKSIIMQGIRSSMAVPLLHGENLFGIMYLDSQLAAGAFTQKDLQILSSIGSQTAAFIQNIHLARKVEQDALTREKFLRMLSPNLAEQVLNGKLSVERGGVSCDMTVMFADIRGFTSMSAERKASEIVEMLNEYFELMVEIIFKYEGTLDKFVGDAIMVVWGAPVAHADDPIRGVKTAIEMMAALDDLNRARRARNQPALLVGIGINTGEGVAGYMGSTKKMEYTVIGNTVNVASRLCSKAAPGEIIVSEMTYSRLNGGFPAEALPPAMVKGISKPLKTYRVTPEAAMRHSTSLPGGPPEPTIQG
jgi:adenylate cyclase